jgi:hypothetical protein
MSIPSPWGAATMVTKVPYTFWKTGFQIINVLLYSTQKPKIPTNDVKQEKGKDALDVEHFIKLSSQHHITREYPILCRHYAVIGR